MLLLFKPTFFQHIYEVPMLYIIRHYLYSLPLTSYCGHIFTFSHFSNICKKSPMLRYLTQSTNILTSFISFCSHILHRRVHLLLVFHPYIHGQVIDSIRLQSGEEVFRTIYPRSICPTDTLSIKYFSI